MYGLRSGNYFPEGGLVPLPKGAMLVTTSVALLARGTGVDVLA